MAFTYEKCMVGPIDVVLFLLHVLSVNHYVKLIQIQFQGMFHLYDMVS